MSKLPYNVNMIRFIIQIVWEKRYLLELDDDQMDELNRFAGWIISHGLETIGDNNHE